MMRRSRFFVVAVLCSLSWLMPAAIRAADRDDPVAGGEADAIRARQEWFYRQRAYPNGIPDHARVRALQNMRAMQDALQRDGRATTQSVAWQPLGPNNVGGRVISLAFDPTNTILYAGAAEGGVWRALPGGGSGWTWTPLTDTADALATGAIALDPTNPRTIYVGTGEWSTYWGGFIGTTSPLYAGAGLLKSTDGGATWTTMGLQNVAAFSRIIVSPDNHQLLWAATNRGVWRSSDAGVTWTAMLPDSFCCDLALDPVNHSRLYIAVQNTGVFGMTDNDLSQFHPLSSQTFPPAASVGRIGLGIGLSGGQSLLYALVSNPQGDLTGIYKYQGFGWTACASIPGLFGTPGISLQGWYDITVAPDPTNASNVIVGGVEMYYSTDAGSSWSPTSIGHPDQHAICWDASGSGTVFVGNDGGVYYSSSGGASFQRITDGLAITQFYGFDHDAANASRLVGGTQDNGSWLGTGAPAWNFVQGGDGGSSLFDPNDATHGYIQTLADHGLYYLSLTGGGGQQVCTGSSFPDTNDRQPWVRAIAVDPAHSGIGYFGTSFLYKYTVGSGYQRISPNLTRGNASGSSTLATIGVAPGGQVIWTGSNDGLVWVTPDRGSTWTNVSHGLAGRTVTHVVPVDDQTAYVTLSGFGPGHVEKTTNRGATWTDISQILPDIPVNAIALDPDRPGHLFIGTDIGVFMSANDGASWLPYMDGLPNVVVTELRVHPQSKMLRASTYGRSVWEAPLNAPVAALGSPMFGPTWYTNQTYPIAWGGVDNATLSYSVDNGATWTLIDQGVTDTVYQWEVPGGINTTRARVRVTNGTVTLVSTPFTIRPPQKGDVLITSAKPYVPYGLAFDGQYLWSTSFYEKKIYKLDPDNLAVLDTIPTPQNLDSCTGVCYAPDQNKLYVHRYHVTSRPQHRIYEINLAGAVSAAFGSPVAYPTGLAYDGTFLYAVDRDSNKIYALDPYTGTVQTAYPEPFRRPLGPRGLAYIGNNEFLHVITDFGGPNSSLLGSYLVRMTVDAQGLHAIDTALLQYEGGAINARAIERDPRYPNSYWISDFGSGTAGTIYRIVGFDVQSLEIGAPEAGAVWVGGTSRAIAWSSGRIDSVALSYTTDNGVTWNAIAGPLQAAPEQTYNWSVPVIPTSTRCKVRVTATGPNGIHSTSNTFTIRNPSAVAEFTATPDGFVLYQNYPNPFSPGTDIVFELPRAGAATLAVTAADGRTVATVAEGTFAAGRHAVHFDGHALPSGVYTYTLRSEGHDLTRTLTLAH